MVISHKQMDDSNFDNEIEREMNNFAISGYVSMKALKVFYDLFFWVYLEKNNIYNAFENNIEAIKLKRLVSIMNLSAFISRDGPAYSAALLYQKMSQIIDMRSFDEDMIIELDGEINPNKFMEEGDFIDITLYNKYKNSNYDIDKSFFIFNEGISHSFSIQSNKMKYYSQAMRAKNKSDLVRKDLWYRLYSKELIINDLENSEHKGNNKIIVLQDSSISMNEYKDKLSFIKNIIINDASLNEYEVEWIEGARNVTDVTLYSKNNYKYEGIKEYTLYNFDINRILNKEKITGEKIIVITDGEDYLEYIPLVNNTLNVISFNDNDTFKGLASINNGKYFKL